MKVVNSFVNNEVSQHSREVKEVHSGSVLEESSNLNSVHTSYMNSAINLTNTYASSHFIRDMELKDAQSFLEEFDYALNSDQSADFGDSLLPYVQNPNAKIFAQGLYNGENDNVAAAAAVVSAAAAAVSAAAAVTSATSASRMASATTSSSSSTGGSNFV